MLLAISVDRLFAVAQPHKYIKRTTKYANQLLQLVYGFCIASGSFDF